MVDQAKAGSGLTGILAAAGAVALVAGARKQISQASSQQSHGFCVTTQRAPVTPGWSQASETASLLAGFEAKTSSAESQHSY